MTPTEEALDVFVSYSHKDQELREELETHLSLLRYQGLIRVWNDRVITAGEEWEGEIHENLESAHFILLLVSPPFMASKYCYDVEMMRAMERHAAGQARVVPIILRQVDWRGAPFGKLQALPVDGRPVTSWPNRDEAFYNVAQGLRGAIEAQRKRRVPPGTHLAPPWLRGAIEAQRKRRAASPPASRPVTSSAAVSSPVVRLTCREMRDRGYLAEIASVFDTAAAADGLLDDAGIPRTRIAPFGQMAPIDFWAAVCRELEKGLIPEGPAALLAAAARAYPHNSVFRAATRV